MRNRLVRWVAGIVLSCGVLPAGAQQPIETAPMLVESAACADGSRFYGGAEYLLWWIKDAPAVPVVTTGSGLPPMPPLGVGGGNAGVLGSGNATVLLGGDDIGFDAFSGARLTLGGWLNADRTFAVEASGFFLGQQSESGSVGSNAAGIPTLVIPVINAAGQESGRNLSLPVSAFGLLIAGEATLDARSRLWGAETNGVFNLRRSDTGSLDALVGFRYADLDEGLVFRFQALVIGAIPIAASDSYATRSQFFGGQLGLRWHQDLGRLFVDVTGKVALGSNTNHIDLQGTLNSPPLGVQNSGFFIPTAALGSQTHHEFSVIPEVTVAVGVDVTERLRASIGYNFMYWSEVVRPGSQIERQGSSVSTNPALYNTTDFWVQGINFALRYSY